MATNPFEGPITPLAGGSTSNIDTSYKPITNTANTTTSMLLPASQPDVSIVEAPPAGNVSIISSPAQAIEKNVEIQSTIDKANQSMQAQAQKVAANQAQAKEAQTMEKQATAETDLKKQELATKEAAAKALLSATSTPTAPKTQTDANGNKYWIDETGARHEGTAPFDYTQTETTTTESPEITAEKTRLKNEADLLNQQATDTENKLIAIENGQFALSADEQAQVNNIKKIYGQMIEDQKLANRNYEAGITQLGIVSGRARYAGELEAGNIANAVNVGLRKIQGIEAEMNRAVYEMTQAFKEKDYEKLTKQYDRYTKKADAKKKELKDIEDSVMEEADRYNKQKKEQLEIEKLEAEMTKTKISGITDLALEMMTGDVKTDQETLRQIAEDQGVNVNELNNAVIARQKALEKEMRPSGEIGQYYEALKLGLIPKGTTLTQFKQLAQTGTATQQEYQMAKNEGYKGSFIDYQKEIASLKATSDATSTIKEYEYAKANGFAGEFSDFKNLANYQKSSATVSNTMANTEEALKLIKEIANPNTPGFSHAVGGNILFGFGKEIAGTESAGFVGKINRLKALLTVDNLKYMRGLGAMSEREFQNMQNIATTLNPQLSEPAFIEEANRVGETLQRSSDKMIIKQMQETGTTDDKIIETLINQGYEDSEIQSLFNEIERDSPPNLSKVGGDTNKAVAVADGTKGGQCGRFVNKYTGIGVGDSYQSKISKMDPSITYPEPGMVFTMPYGNTGHVGIIVDVQGDMATVKDSNYSLDEKVKTHQIPVAKMTGFRRV